MTAQVIVIGVAAFFGMLFFGIMWQVRKVAGFVYVNTKVAVSKLKTLSNQDLIELKKDKFAYKKVVQYMQQTKQEPSNSEQAAAMSQADYLMHLADLKELCPKEGKIIVGSFIQRWETEQMQKALRSLIESSSPQAKEILDELPEKYFEYIPSLVKLLKAKTVQEAKDTLKNTSYAKMLSDESTDASADKSYLEMQKQSLETLKQLKVVDKPIILQILLLELDIHNSLVLISSVLRHDIRRAQQSIIPTLTSIQERISNYLIKNAEQKGSDGQDSKAALNSFRQVFEGTLLQEAYNKAIQITGESPAVFEKEFRDALQNYVKDCAQAKILGPVPVVAHIYELQHRMRKFSVLSYLNAINEKTIAEMVA